MKKIFNTMLSLLLLPTLLAGCSKDEVPEPAPPYELRLNPSWAKFTVFDADIIVGP